MRQAMGNNEHLQAPSAATLDHEPTPRRDSPETRHQLLITPVAPGCRLLEPHEPQHLREADWQLHLEVSAATGRWITQIGGGPVDWRRRGLARRCQ